jgi:N-methylhydantoinase A/oxoprolinase/acetone carboxylase beta subunit
MIRRHPTEFGDRIGEPDIVERAGDYVVGIDTGGTYTDGVLLAYRSREVIASGKTLTTREDLTIGITAALESLRIEDPSRVKLVGISSTLATNSIAEGKGRRAGLVLIGYDPELIQSYGLESKFPTKDFAYFAGGHTSQGEEREPLDLGGITAWIEEHQGRLDALAVSSYFSPLDPSHEERAFAALRRVSNLPAVLGHQLSTKLDSIKRATTACLNASLVAVMQEFIEAVRTSLKEHGIHAPLMIVRGDGSLMPYTEAAQKPVETILSGPAASAIGGRFLSGNGSALVVDVGGTTTDLALIENFQMTISEEGARVGGIQTAVEAARIRTASLGCDSRISLGPGTTIHVGPDRVVPLSRLASLFPQVARDIALLDNKRMIDRRPTDAEYWFLHKQLDAATVATLGPRHADLVAVLAEGPRSVTRILEDMGLHHVVQLDSGLLVRQGLIEHATLTPTDLLHIAGQISLWNSDAAHHAVRFLCEIHERDPRAVVQETLDLVVAQMVEECVVFLARQAKTARLPERVEGAWGQWLLREALTEANPYLSVNVASRFPLIGIGAPAGYFVKRVAELLRARFILPPHAPVANAVGAVAGSVMVEKEAIVYLQETDSARAYVVQVEGGSNRFLEVADAYEHAEAVVTSLARERALDAGAVEPQVVLEATTEGALRRIRRPAPDWLAAAGRAGTRSGWAGARPTH